MPPIRRRLGKLAYRFSHWLDELTYRFSLPALLGGKKRRRRKGMSLRNQLQLERLEPIMLLSAVTWTGAAGDNNWDTGGNWSTGTTPGTGDDVTINLASPITITHSAAVTDTINSLVSNTAIVLSGGALNVTTTLSDSAGLTLSGGTLGNATVQSGTTITGTATGGTLSNVTLDGTLDLQANNAATATISNGLALNGSILVGNTAGTTAGDLFFSGSETVSGNGTIQFGANAGNEITYDASLTLGGIIQGGSGTITNIASGTSLQTGTVIAKAGGTIVIDPTGLYTNRGDITADGGTVTVNPGTCNNFFGWELVNGSWTAMNGGVLRLIGENLTTNVASITLSGANSHIYSDTGTTNALAGLSNNAQSGSIIGRLTLEDGADFTAAGAFSNSGQVVVFAGSTFRLNGANNYTQTGGTTGVEGGTLVTGSGSVLINGGYLTGQGTISSNVTVGSSGTLQLGQTAGSLAIEGGLLLQGTLQDNIAGNQSNSATGYQQLDISGSFTNNGTVNVSPVSSFVPGPLDTFQIIAFASYSGTGSINVAGSMNLETFFDSNSLWLVPNSTVTETVTTTADSGAGNLRQALGGSIIAPSIVLVVFNLSTSDPNYNSSTGIWTIAPGSALPDITHPTLLDAATQPGYAGKPVIDLSGISAGNSTVGLKLTAGNSIVDGLVINNFGSDAIELTSSGDDVIEGNYLGTDAAGNSSQANGDGISVVSVSNVTIGGSAAQARNIISGNRDAGIVLGGSDTLIEGNYIGTNAAGTSALTGQYYGVENDVANNNTISGNVISGNADDGLSINAASGVLVQGNYIGTDATGTIALANGSNAGQGFFLSGSNNTVGGTTAAARNIISGNSGDGLDIFGIATTGNLIEGNYIGTNAAGTAALANAGNGMVIQNGSTGNTIGGTTAAARNIISGNSGDGIEITGSGTSSNIVQGDYIGTDVSGSVGLGNSGLGVLIDTSAANNAIGGTATGAGNVISANGQTSNYTGGLWILGSGTSGNVVAGNLIGTDKTGTAPLGNHWSGIEILGATGNTIGGTAAGAANVISANDAVGVEVREVGASLNVVAGNFIGTDKSGTSSLGNTREGVAVWNGATNNTIGGTTPASRNIISGNSGDGVDITGSGTSSNVVDGNYIGTNAAGTASLANSTGVFISGSNNTIGGTITGAGNIISGNTSDGILLTSASNNQIEGNYIGLGFDGTTALGNGLQGIEDEASNNTIGGTTAAARNVISANGFDGIRINGAGGAASGNTVEGNYIGTNAAGTAAAGAQKVGIYIQYAANNTIGGLTNTAGTAAGNLLSGNAIVNMNIVGAASTGNVVQGNLIGTDATGASSLGTTTNAGVQIATGASSNTIGGLTATARNVISGNSGAGIKISGSGTSGNLVEGDYIGTNAAGTATLANSSGVVIQAGASGNTVGGATTGAGNVISGNSGDGVDITDSGSSGNVVAGNFIGTNAAGTVALANGNDGIFVEGGASNNTIGGTTAGAANVLSGNSGQGVELNGSGTSSNLVEGNYIGTDVTGTAALANTGAHGGVYIFDAASNNTIGGTTAAARNIISGNTYYGVEILGTDYSANLVGANGNVIEGNYIGTDVTGTAALANFYGVMIVAGAGNNTIGGTTAGAGNLISGNSGDGVDITGSGSSGNVVEGDYIGTNAAGTGAAANGGGGVFISSANNTIGGSVTGAGNIISGNSGDGIEITGTGATGNVAEGNYIGTNAAGTAAIPNQFVDGGVFITAGASNNTIGGTSAAERNIISGNASVGVYLKGASTNVVEGNYIGTNAAGTVALGNGDVGIQIDGGSTGNTIGGISAGSSNVVSADAYGVFIRNTGTTANVVEGNFIGTDYTGTAALGNNGFGVAIDRGASGNSIGGTTAAARNIISGNRSGGVEIGSSAGGSNNNVLEGNYIGTNAAGTAALVNTGSGVVIQDGSTNNTIGGTAAGAGNLISGNTGDGVWITGSGVTGNAVLGNYIGTAAAGTASAVAIANDGFETPNQGTGSTAYTYGPTGAGWTFAGGTGITANNTNWGVADATNGNSDGTTSSAGQAAFIQGGNGTTTGSAIYQTITGFSAGTVSIEFSLQGRNGFGTNPIKVMLDGQDLGTYTPQNNDYCNVVITPTVTVTAGAHTLYFIGTNSTGDTGVFIDNVRVNIGNRGSGIAVVSGAANNILGTSGAGNVISGNDGGFGNGITIDAASHNNTIAGNSIGTDAVGNAVLGNANDGVSISGASNTIGGNTPGSGNIISGNNNAGVVMNGTSATANLVAGNSIGTNAAGSAALGNTLFGVQVIGGAQTNVIGTNGDGVNDAAEGNVISGNGFWGVYIGGQGTNNNVLAGNLVGTDKTGMSAVANGVNPNSGGGGGGAVIDNLAANNRIGTNGDGVSDALERNVISGNSGWDGIMLQSANNNVVAGNYIGVAANGLTALSNGAGIDIKVGSQGNRIGVNPTDSDSTAERNIISGNQSHGIQIWSSSANNVVAGNFIGTDKNGATAVGNAAQGIFIFNGAHNNIIGGTTAAARNIISGNAQDGVQLNGSGTTGNTVEGNFIGTDVSGNNALANGGIPYVGAGVDVINGASGNTIGGLTGTPGTGAGNVISGNSQRGIAVDGDNNDLIEGNIVGLNAAGTAALGNAYQGVEIDSGTGNIIGGTTAGAGNVISESGGGYGGVFLSSGTTQTLVQGNYIGTDITGTKAFGNATDGIEIVGATNNTIGGTTAAARNVISGNLNDGVYITDASNFYGYTGPSTGNVVEGNYIGTDATGTLAVANNSSGGLGGGVDIYNASGNTVGGLTSTPGTGAGNVISGNGDAGIFAWGNSASNRIEGNLIGTDATGTQALGNGFIGLFAGVRIASPNNTVGGTAAGAGNVISANAFAGIQISAQGTVVQGNYIGTDITGTKALGNHTDGIGIGGNIPPGPENILIGGTNSTARNVIAGNLGDAININGSSDSGNLIEGNFIGTNAAGTTALGNSQNGVSIAAPGNTIGGTAAGQGNTIAYNGDAGVAVVGWTSTQNSVRGNLIFANTGLGIDLGDTGTILANDSQGHTGPNKNANFPVLNSVTAGPNTVVSGSLQNASTPGTIYYLDFYANTTQNTSGHGDAQVYLGSTTVTTDSTGLALFSAGGLGATTTGQYVTATATDAGGNTSEFALNAVPAIADSPPSVSISGTASLPASGIPVALGSTITDSQTGKTYTYAWNVTSSTNPAFALPAGTVTDEPNLTFTPSAAGTYVATLTVTDSLGGVGKATPLTITVNSGGQIVAINNTPADAAVNAPMTLNAAVTEPPGLSVTNYAWNVTLNGSTYTQTSGPTASTFTFTPATAGSYVVTLTATNSAGSTGSTSVSFAAVTPGVTIQGTPHSAGIGTPITVGAAVNDPNLSGALTYNWSVTDNGTTVTSASNSTGFFTFTPSQLGSYVFSLTVTDAQGHTIAAAPVTLQVVSQAPGVSITGAPAGALVGTALSLGSQVTEPVGLSTTAYAWSILKDGLPYVPAISSGAATPSFSFTPDAGGMYTVTLLATDNQGTVGGSSVSILVSSGAVAIGGLPPSVGEGTPVTLTATPVDPNVNGSENYNWSVANTAGVPVGSGIGASFTFTPAQEGSYTISLTATNSSNQVLSTSTATLAVTNVSPTVAISGIPTNPLAGVPITLAGSANTPGSSDTFTYVWSLLGTDGQTTTGQGTTFTFTPTGGPNVVTLTATDEAGGSASTSVVISAAQAAGGIQLSQEGAFSEGGQATMQAAFVNPPASVSYNFSWTVSGQSVPYSASGNGTLLTSTASSFSFTPPAPGIYLVNVTAQGSDSSTASASELVTVANVPPTVSITGLPTAPIDEGTEVNLGSNVSDPGLPSDVMQYQWTVTGPKSVFSSSAANFSFVPDESGLYAVSLTVTDDSGAAVTTTGNFTVAHVAPVPLVENAAGTGVNGSSLTVNLTASVPDPGNDDTFSYAWTALDQTTSQVVAQGNSANFSFSGPVGDALIVSVTITDGEGGDVSATVPILVAQVGQTLTLSPSTLPSGTTQVLALALGSAEIDGSGLSIPLDAAALGSHDTLIGGSGPNVLQGDSGFNSLLGGSGPNTLIATAGDSLLGGSGSNLFSILPGSGESVQSAGANNTLSFAGSSTGITLNLSQVGNNQQTQFAGYDGTSTDVLTLQGTFQNLVGSGGADNLFAASNSIVYGGGGNDTLTASGISDATLAAGSGNVVLSATGSSNVLLFAGNGTLGSSATGVPVSGNTSLSLAGDAGNSSLSVSAGGDDTLQADNSSNVTMIAASGTATLAATGGSNILQFGGTGNDSLYSSGGSSIYMQGGTGNSTLSSSGGSSITQFGGTGNDSLYSTGGSSIYMQGGTGNTTLSSTGGSSITQFGGTGNDSLYSSGGSSIYMQGGSGNTTLSSSGGSSITQFGGTGNDSLYSSGGSSIYMQGGTGNTTLSSSGGSSITQFGGTGNDSLYSTGGSSIYMQGGSGNTTLSSSGGSSITQFGGTGNDSLYSTGGSSIYMQGGAGNTTLSSTGGSSITQFGGTGNDSLYSTGGSSVLMVGGSGNTTLSSTGGSSITQFGGTGNDSLYSTGGSSIYMQGGTGNSTLSSSGGSSITQFGGTGNDSLYSSGGSSIYMQGGAGNATLASTGGSSITQFGGTGNDSLYSTGGSSIYMQGGTGNSTLSSSGGSSITQFGGTGNDSLYSTGGSSVLMVGGSGNTTLSSSGGSSITQFGGTGNDSLYSTGGSSIYMQGGTGNSTLSSTGGSSITQFGGTGNDSLYSSGGSSIYMQGGSGSSTLSSSVGSSITQFGGTGNDSLYSTGGSSVVMVGGSGNTTLSSSGGSSITQFGGTGNDSLYSTGGSSIYMQGGSGNTTLSSSGGSSITQFGGTGNDSLYSTGGSSIYMQGGTGNSTLSSSGGSSITQFGGTGNDSLYSTGGSSVLMVGGSGNTTLSSSGGSSITQFGGTGNDSLYSTGGSSIYMQGGTGNSTLSSSGGSSITQFGGTGNDSLYSTGGSSVLMVGGSGNTTLSSSGGSSITQFGGTGNDSLYSTGGSSIYTQGGTGDSTLSSSGGSSITQFGGTGNDSLYSSGGSSIYMQGGSGSSTLSSSGSSSITQFGGTGNDSLYSTGGSSVLMVGGSGNTTLSTSGGSSVTQFGGTGNDSLYSSGGSSVLMIGGNGNSTLSSSGGSSITQFGGTGNDSLYSTGGSSIYMQAGSGNSTLSSSGGSSITQFGGTGNDSLYSSGGSSVLMVGGSGNTTLSSSGGSSITQFGGTGNDSLYSTGGSSIYMQGGSGNTTLSSSGGSSITQFGGSGNDSLYSSSGSSILMVGGSGTDSLTASGVVNALVQAGGATNDVLTATGGNSVSLVGGSGNDTLSAAGGMAIVLAGLDGDNTYELSGNLSASLNDLSTFGQSLPNVDGATQGTNTILFPGLSSGIHLDLNNFSQGTAPTSDQIQNVASGMSLSLIGQFQNVVGGAGNNWIHGDGSSNVLQGGGTGSDTLIGGSGSTTLLAGSGNDSLVGGSGGTVYRFAGSSFGSDTIAPASSSSNDTLDFSQLGGAVNLNLASSTPQTVSAATGLTLTLANPLGITGVIDTASTANPYNDAITGNGRGDVFTVGTGNDAFTGSGGDSYSFSGTHLGSDVLNEAAGTQNTLNFLGLGGPVNLNLSQPVHAAAVSPGNLTLTLSNPSAFTTVVGTPYADNITGNSSNDTIIGAGGEDSLVGGSGSNYIQGDITQVVYLHFPTSGTPGDLIYTAAEANAIQKALAQDYSGFNYVFTQDPNQAQQLAQMTGGQYVTLNFGSGPAGGAAEQLDVDHLHLDGSATIDITSFLGQASFQVTPTLTNIINLTTTIAAHELGHLSGLQHQDAFGPIGSGIYAGVNPQSFYPVYTGPTDATQTPNDVMASPDSVDTTLQNAAGQTYLGERDLIKLAYNDTGVLLSQSNLSSVQAVTTASQASGGDVVLPDAGTVYELGNLPVLAVPNTLPAGVPGSGQTFTVTAAGVNATIKTGQVQYYAFQGSAGELMSFQVISGTNTLNPHPILPALEVLDANGNLVPYAGNATASAFYGAGAVNQHEFESNDSTLYDVTLPTTGTYYVGVTTLPISPPGNYQLFMYSFGTDPDAKTAGDTLVGGSGTGNDTLVGSSGNDSIGFLPGYTGQATVYSGSGQDTLNLSTLPPANPLQHVTIVNQSSVSSFTTILPTITTVSSQPALNPDVYGGSVTLTATVTAEAGTPTGSVTFYNNGQSLGSATLQNGSASLTLATLPAGNDSITAAYASDSSLFTNSTSSAITQAVAQAQPTFRNLAPSQSIAYGTPTITLSGHLIANAGQQTIPAGESVTATIDGISQSATLDDSDNFTIVFNSSTVAASATPWTISYSYGGDTNYQAAADNSTTLTITTIPTTISVPSATVTSDFGQPLTLTATVATQPASKLVPAGSVDFFDNTTQTNLGSVALSVNGTAQLVTDDLPAGTQTITLTFTDPHKNFLSSSTTVGVAIVPSIYVLNPTVSGALSLAGNATITSPGLVVVDSSSTTALVESGNDKITASGIELVGGASISGNSSLSAPPTHLSAAAPDPLAILPVPSATGLTLQGSVNLGGNSTLTINPGIYSSINVSGKASLTMNPGIYVIAGGGFAVTGNASVTGSGVLIYNAGSNYNGGSGTSFGGLTLTGNGTIDLSAATTGPYAGIVIFQARDNTRAISLSGNGEVGLGGGIVYAPSALMSLSGNVQLGSSTTPSSPLVVNQLQLLGNAASDLAADSGTDGTGSNTAGQLLAGNVTVYVDNSSNDFTADELARIQDAVNSANVTVAPYGVSVSEVDASQSAYATTIITLSTSSAAGSAADDVLGCESSTGITLVPGWNWYTGSDPRAIGSSQYDLETIVLHEVGHALGLGHSPLSSSVMYADLAYGTTKRTLTAADLNISDTDSGPCALHAAIPEAASQGPSLENRGSLLPPANDLLAKAMQAIEPLLLLRDASSDGAIESTLVATDMGWLTKWVWLMLGVGQDPDRPALVPQTGPEALAVGSSLSPRSLDSESAAGLGSSRNAAVVADGSATLREPLDIVALDQFFQQPDVSDRQKTNG